MEEKIKITGDSFGSNCPQNWEEIADFLNDIIEEKTDGSKEASEEVWEDYCNGKIENAPEAVF